MDDNTKYVHFCYQSNMSFLSMNFHRKCFAITHLSVQIFRAQLQALKIISEWLWTSVVVANLDVSKAFLMFPTILRPTHSGLCSQERVFLFSPTSGTLSTHLHSLFLEYWHLYSSELNDQESNSLSACRANPLSYSLSCPVTLPRPLFNWYHTLFTRY